MTNSTARSDSDLQWADKCDAYNAGYRMTRHPTDPQYHVAPPRDDLLRHYFYQGVDDARRSMLARGAA